VSYRQTARWLTRRASPRPYDGPDCTWRDPLMNTIIYIVGLVVVVGFILSFIGLI
jgi:hypothetical protein